MTANAVVSPVAAAIATIAAATALTGVIQGWGWLGYVVVATVLVTCTGMALRALRAHPFAVGAAQLLVLLFLVVGAFTRSGFLVIVPGPAALTELNDVLVAAFEEIRTGLPPVEGTTPIVCLVTIAIGLVAVVVDILAVTAAAPAATGLILLCVYAVPSALAGELLPWWTFALGAAAFAGLLAVDGSHRHRSWRNRGTPGLGASPGSVSAPVAVVAAALAAGLVAGTAVTGIGTEGSLPGSSSGSDDVPGGLGINPFTSLRGMLDEGTSVELFRVHGLGQDRRLLRAFTLDTYRPNEGWGLPEGPMPAGVPADGPLPAAPGDDGTGESRPIRIEPVNWVDLWLPVFGAPRSLHSISDGWYYDRTSGTVFRERRQRPGPYVEVASLEEPSRQELRASEPAADDVPPVYTEVEAVDPRVRDLAEELTADAPTTFDKAQAIWSHFTSPGNGFIYDTQTAPASDPDALADFVLNGKRGFCEQYASAMAVMLRSIGIPARVAVGFTTGYPSGDTRVITSQDAHAWVEVYFGDEGWVGFDPTPLSDGRGYVPEYLRAPQDSGNPGESPGEEVPTASSSVNAPSSPLPGAQSPSDTAQNRRPFYAAPSWSGWGALGAALVALLATAAVVLLGRRIATGRPGSGTTVPAWLVGAALGLWVLSLVFVAWQLHWAVALFVLIVVGGVMAPAAIREVVRMRRLQDITQGRASAADAAWQELLDEAADRGIEIPRSDTVRLAAQKVAQRHRLDEQGKNDLRTVVGVVERSWYSPPSSDSGARDQQELARAFHGLRDSLHRSAPLSWRGRLLPRSLFRRRSGR